jgi:hypothetical protein
MPSPNAACPIPQTLVYTSVPTKDGRTKLGFQLMGIRNKRVGIIENCAAALAETTSFQGHISLLKRCSKRLPLLLCFGNASAASS